MSHPTNECETCVGDRCETRERLIADRAEPERQQDPAECGKCSSERKGEEFGPEHVDPQCGCGSLVRSNSDESATTPTPTYVGDHPHRDYGHGKHKYAVTLRVPDRTDVVAKQIRVTDLGAPNAAGVTAVAEQHELHGRAQPKRNDGQVDAPGSNRREGEEQTEWHCC